MSRDVTARQTMEGKMSEETKAFDEMQNGTSETPETPVTQNEANSQPATADAGGAPVNPEDAKNQELYSRGVQLMQEKKFDQAIKCFDKIPQYKDSKQKSEEAKKIKEETRRATSYDNAIKAFNTGHYDTAIVLFTSLKDYKDSKAKLAICTEKRESARKEAAYNDLLTRVSAEVITTPDLEKLIEELKAFSGYKDADAQVKKQTKRLEEQKEAEAEAKRKKKKRTITLSIIAGSVALLAVLAIIFVLVILPDIRYDKAEKLMSEGRYEEALEIYESLDGRFMSDARAGVIRAMSTLSSDVTGGIQQALSADVPVKINYNRDGGFFDDDKVDETVYYSDEEFYRLATPIKPGYTFKYWELESYNYSMYDYMGGMLEVTLKPVYKAITYTVWLENTTNVGTDSSPEYVYSDWRSATIKVTYGSSYTLPTITRDDYVLTGWYNGKDKVESPVWNIASDVTLTPMWEGKEFTVTLNPDGGSVSSTSVNVKYDTIYTLPTPTWAGHSFTGWYNGSQRINVSGTWSLKSDVTLVARWDTDVYDISYNLNGGAVSGSNPDEYTVYDEFTLEAPTKVGYTFVGWTYDGQSTPVMELTVSVGTIGNKTYTANWTADTYTVTLDLNGGTMSGSTTITVTYDGSYVLPSNVTRVGYTFAGWSKGSSPFDSEGVWQIADDDVTLTARWTPNTNTPYTVEHYLQNSNGEGYTLHATDRFTGTTGASVLTYVNTYPHYVSPTAETVIIAADGSTVVRYYYDVATYYIVYATGGGDDIENQAFRYGQTPTADAVPTRDGYTFGGWFIDAELTTSFELTSAPEGNVTAYAWWTEEAKPSDFTYSGTDEITITDYSGTATVVIVPPYIGTVPVTEIADSVFAGNTNITKVIIPDTVTEMGDGIFAGCTSLTELVLPSVFSASSNVSLYTTSTYRWTIGGNGTSRSNNQSQHSSTATYTITATVNMTLVLQYRVSSESGCDKLSIQKNGGNLITPISGETSYTTITISLAAGESVVCKYSKDGTANRGDDRAYVNIISAEVQATSTMGSLFGTTSIEGTTAATQNSTTYYVPTSLRKVTVTSGDIGDYAFAGFSMLEEVQLENVESISRYAFSGCSSLKRVNSTTDGVFVIPDSVTSIGQNAFANCNALETMTVPFIGSGADSDYGFSFIFGNVPTSLTEIIITTDTTIPQSAFYNLQYVESITLPSGVTSISDNAFNSCVSLTDIEIPDTVRSIGNSAFSGCISLEEIDIPDSVTSIGSNSFYGCISLTSIELPESLTSIGSYAFSGCTSLEAVELPEFLTSIEDYAFSGCTGIKKINSDTDGELRLPEELETIGSYAFQNLTQITSVVVPDSVTSIGYYAFSGCNAVESITVPFVGANADATSQFYYIFGTVPSTLKNITITTDTTIPDSAFQNLSYVESITIPSDVTSIGTSAFYGCSSLEEIEIPDSVTSIGNYAFQNCISLTAIELPESLTSIGSNVFSGCTALERINSDTTGELILPEGLETIGSYAFQGLTQITKVVIPDSVTSIGSYAFSGCTGIKKINSDTDGELRLPEELETIGAYAFQNLSQITSVVIPDSVTSIGSYAFSGCNAVESITVPFTGCSATSTSSSAYFDCIFGSSSSNVPGTLKNITVTIDTTIPDYAFRNLSYVESITIPSDVTTIGNSAFSGCSSLEEIEIPDSVISMGSYAFQNCSSLTAIELPESLTSIGDYVFYGCTSITTIEFPESLRNIGNYAFQNCTSITAIELPETLTSIGSYAFSGCTGIKKINSDTDGEMILPEGLETIGAYAFQNISQITSVVVPDSVTSIGQQAFRGCAALTTITVPFIGNSANSTSSNGYFSYIFGSSSVPSTLKNIVITTDTTIPEYAFQNLSYVESITVSSNLKSISSRAFSGCTNLKRINSTTDGVFNIPDSVESIGIYAFYGCSSLETISLPFIGNTSTSSSSYFYQIFGESSYVPNTLKNITITRVTTIPTSAFSNLSYVESITIPSDVTSIGMQAFYGCTSLKRLNSTEDGVFNIPAGVTVIQAQTFYNCYAMTKVTIPASVTSIGNYAFNGCSTLERVNSNTDGEMILPDGLKTIGSYAFQNLSQITKVVVPDSVTTINEYAFRGCNAIEDITLPFVGRSAADNNNRYAVFGHIFGRYTNSTTSKPSGTTYQGWGQYSSSYPTSGESGRNYSSSSYYYADYYYIPTSIKRVTITVDTTIPYGAFHNCSFIETITLPTGATEGDYAYQNCAATVNKTYVPKLSVWDGSSESTSLSGEGTEETPYQINSAADLAYLASSVNSGESYEGKYFVLNVNVNLNNYSWTPIGTAATPFAGIFDGNGKKIIDVYINTSSSTYLGLFGYVSGTVKDLGIASGTITLTSSSANSYVGGLVGYLSGTVENCYSNATVSGSATQSVYVGGLVGYVNTGATVNNSYATGNATSTSTSNVFVYAGGLAGYNKGTITGSLAFGNVTANGYKDAQSRNGGLVGRNDDGTITGCYRSEDQVLTKYHATDNAYCTDGTEASYSDMMEYAEENWDSDVWSFDLKYPTHK